jgi:hypothetical protein
MKIKWGVAIVAVTGASMLACTGRAETPEQGSNSAPACTAASAPSFRPASGSVSMRSSVSRPSGGGVRYAVADEWMAKIVDWNKNLDPAGRYQAAMSVPGLFEVATAP